MKKIISLLFVLTLVVTLFTGCSSEKASNGDAPSSSESSSETINVVSREDGSGTRGAFIEIVGILEKDSNGNENDNTYEEAIIQNGTDAVMNTVAGDKNSIGYISIGSLNDTVKALKIDDAEATAENVQNNSYKISRPFNVAYKGDLNDLSKDFLNFILSSEGQEIVEKEGYVQANTAPINYSVSNQEGNLIIAGSTSVSPVMEKLAEKYESLNSKASIEIQSTGSSAGMQSTMEGSSDIGMASRELKDSEKEALSHEAIAIDGIAVIVNNKSSLENLTLDKVKSIYTGQITTLNDL